MNTNKNIENIIEDGMMEYASYVLLDRCLPALEDGMKPVHRRILYSMYLQKAFKLTKSANVAGQVMALHPHGSTYGTMVGMAQKDKQSVPLLVGKGNFGQYTSRNLQPAADRYTEIKLSDLSVDMMKNFDKNVVEFIDNYDGTMKMPKFLPVKFPNILTYAQSGIGVGFSSSTPSFNLKELCKAMTDFITTGNRITLVPDFATGGSIIEDKNVFEQINTHGNGTVRIRGTANIEKNKIIITEVPYTTTREAIIEKVISLVKAGKLKEIMDIKDLTGLKGMEISVVCRKNVNMEEVLEKLYRFTPLESTFSSNMNILVDNLPKVLGVWSVIEEWIRWRRKIISNELAYEIKHMKDKLHMLKGLEKVLLDIDKVVEVIRFSEERLIELSLSLNFKIDKVQAKEISNMKLRNINKEYIIRKVKDIKKLEEEINSYESILKDSRKLDQIVIKGLEETSEKYGHERRTKIIKPNKIKIVRLVEEVPNYPVRIHLTKEGYCFKFRGTQEPSLKPGDEVLRIFETNNDSEILIFGEDRTCHKVQVKDIDETRINQLGTYLISLVRDKSLKIISYSILDEVHNILIAAYSNNRIAKINLKSFSGNRRVLKNAFNHSQELVDMLTLKEDTILTIITDKTKLELGTEKLTLTNSRGATGVYCTRKGIMKSIEYIETVEVA